MIDFTWLLAQSSRGEGAFLAGCGLVTVLISLMVAVVVILGYWKTFDKAGQPGWAALIPFFNIYVLCRVAGRPGWWLILFFIPLVSFVIYIIVCLDIAAKFGKGTLFAIGLIFLAPIFFLILGFDSSTYRG